VGKVQRASDEPTIVQRQATEMPLRESVRSAPATEAAAETSEVTPTASSAGTIQASPETNPATPSVQRTASSGDQPTAPSSVQRATTPETTSTAARPTPSIQCQETP